MINLRKSRGNQKGFTMIELIFVGVILAILVAGAVPLYNQVANNSKTSRAQADMKVAYDAIMRFYVETGAFPTAAQWTSNHLVTSNYIDAQLEDVFSRTTPKARYYYQAPTAAADGFIWSVGPNGANNNRGGDDVVKTIRHN